MKFHHDENRGTSFLQVFIVCLFQSRDVICFIIGGVTYEESFHIYRLNKELAGKFFFSLKKFLTSTLSNSVYQSELGGILFLLLSKHFLILFSI
mgnify:CR=1 FL=1